MRPLSQYLTEKYNATEDAYKRAGELVRDNLPKIEAIFQKETGIRNLKFDDMDVYRDSIGVRTHDLLPGLRDKAWTQLFSKLTIGLWGGYLIDANTIEFNPAWEIQYQEGGKHAMNCISPKLFFHLDTQEWELK